MTGYECNILCDKYIAKMEQILPSELIEYIIKEYIYRPYNIQKIQTQHKLKESLAFELTFFRWI